ncbi:hypothetical protein IMZ48_24620 [Candidatus Bathyarchaeota archaeon]|nr:hypothetical protein [Candidatus Bathyarchaeota archaeon]
MPPYTTLDSPVYNRPFRASSTFLAASPALYPPLEMQTFDPSLSSNLSW